MACVLGGFLQDVGHRVVSAVCAWADRCEIAEAIKNLAAQRALRVSGEGGNADAALQSRSSEIRSPIKEGGGPRDLVGFEGDPVPFV